jgi:hypothetical protein
MYIYFIIKKIEGEVLHLHPPVDIILVHIMFKPVFFKLNA